MDDLSHTPQKRCAKCKQFLPATFEFFYSHKSAKDGLHSRCKPCWKVDRKPRYIPPEGYKHCPRCKQDYPKTVAHFYSVQSRPDGLATYCKACQHERQVEAYNRAKTQTRIAPDAMICSRCGSEKPANLQFFAMNPLCRYGLNTICKACMNARTVQIHRTMPEATRSKWRALYRRGSLYYKNRYQQKRKQILSQQHAFKLAHPEIVRGWKHSYARTERGLSTHRKSQHNRRSRQIAAQGTYTLQEIEQQQRRQKGKCYYCRQRLAKYHIEHVVPLSRGGRNDMSNIVLSCPTCNLKKGAKMPHEWVEGGHLL